jgi:hydroxypyruvate isomerase
LNSHYKGGVAAAAFDQFAKMSADDFKKANIASNSVKGRKVELEAPPTLEKPKRQAGINLVIEALEKKKTPVSPLLKQMRNNQQLKETGAYLLFLLTTGLSVAFYVTFKSYHSALTKLNSLKKLLASPNARVAHGETGKNILKRLRAEQHKTETPALITKATKSNETVDLLKQLIEARQTEKEYAAPLLEEAPKRLTAAKQPDNSLELIK